MCILASRFFGRKAVVDGLADSGRKTITIAPETGGERLRRVINKGLAEEHLKNAATLSAKSGIQHMRLYIMIGLPPRKRTRILKPS